MKTNLKNLFSLFLLLTASVLFAQKTVSGTVTDQDGFPISDAAVTVQSTGASTYTDDDGNFSIEANEGDVIEVDALGFALMNQTVGSSSTLDFSVSAGNELDEVVVTALGISREKKALGYATQEISGDDIADVKSTNFADALSGEVAGLDIQSFNQMGGSANMVVRGYSSLTQSNQALVVVDGTPIINDINTTSNQQTGRGGYDYGNAAMDINPDDIADINVLKGSAATALYGSRASNGAIIITTKKGSKKNKGLGISINSSYMASMVNKETLPEYQNQYGAGYGRYYTGPDNHWGEVTDFDEDGVDDLIVVTGDDASYGAAFDPSLQVFHWNALFPQLPTYKQKAPWIAAKHTPNDFYQTGGTFNNSISFDGGNEKTVYRMGWSNMYQTGILPNSKINRNTINLNVGHDINDKLNVSGSLNFTTTRGKGRYGTGYDGRNPNQSFRQWYQTNVDIRDLRRAYKLTGENLSWNVFGSDNLNPHYFDNPYWDRYRNFSTDSRDRLYGNVALNYEFSDWFSLLARVTHDGYSAIEEERIDKGAVDVAKYLVRNKKVSESNYDLIGTFTKDITDKISLNGLLGWNLRVNKWDNAAAQTNGGLVVPGIFTLANTLNGIGADNLYQFDATKKVDGIYAATSFGFDDTFFLDATVRRDRSSALPVKHNDYTYYSLSGSFVFSNLVNASWLSFGKLRGNYAKVGNDVGPFRVNSTYNINTTYGDLASLSNINTLQNPDLKPEESKEYEFGLEMQFLKNRFGIDVSYYNRKTEDLITDINITAATGSSAAWFNVGSLENKGIELFLNATPIKKSNFQWDIKFNFAQNRSELLSLTGDLEFYEMAGLQGGVTIGAKVGDPFGVIRGRDYIYDDAGNKVVGSNGFYLRTAETDNVLGDINPDWTGGVKNNFRFKNFNLGFLIDVQKGGDVFSLDTWYGYATGLYANTTFTNDLGNPVRNTLADGGGIILDGVQGTVTYNEDGSYTVTNTSPNEVRARTDYFANPWGYYRAATKDHIYDASFVKLRELTLSYSLPIDFVRGMGIQDLSIGFIGRNLWIIDKNTPYTDPEAGLSAGNIQGYQSGAYASTREFGMNVNIKF